MIHRATRFCAAIAFGTLAFSALGQDAPAKPEAEKSAGYVFADFNQGMPDEAFDVVAKQAGVELVTSGDQMWNSAEAITLKVEGGYFWPVFLDMCKQANLRFQPDYGGPGQGRRLRLFDARQMGGDSFDRLPRCAYQGFVVMPQSANRSYNITYGNAAPNSYFTIQMQVLVDPQTPVTGWGMTNVTEAVDENGTSLVLRGDRSNMFSGGGMNSALISNATVPLANPTNIGKKLVSLKGTLRGTAVTKMEKVELDLPLPAEGKTIKTSDGDVIISALTPRAGQSKSYELKIQFQSAPVDGTVRGGIRRQGNDQWNLVNSVVIKDAQGKALNVGGGSGSGDSLGNMTYSVSVSAQDAGEPAMLSWRLPVTMKQIQIPFEFKDLPIP